MAPPLPPRAPNNKASSVESMPRMRSSPGELNSIEDNACENEKQVISPRSLLGETPETTIGKNVIATGKLEFGRLVRIDGSFSGKLVSKGDLIVGSGGILEGNVDGMGSLFIEGKVVGNIAADTVYLQSQAEVFGNITCKSITVEPDVVIVGEVNINPKAPQKFDSEGKEVKH